MCATAGEIHALDEDEFDDVTAIVAATCARVPSEGHRLGRPGLWPHLLLSDSGDHLPAMTSLALRRGVPAGR
jgi:hypothetical protein